MISFKKLLVTLPQSWSKFWFKQISSDGIRLFRVLFGIFLLAYLSRYMGEVELHFSSLGVYIPYWFYDFEPPAWIAHTLFWFMILCCIAIVIGWKTQLTTPFLLLLYTYHYILNFALARYSYDLIIIQYLMILSLAETTAIWSRKIIDAKNAVCTLTDSIEAWPIYLLKIHLIILYLGSGLWKVFNPYWHDGKLIQYTYIGIWSTPVSFWFVGFNWPEWFYDYLTWAVIGFELLIGFLLLPDKTRSFAIFLGSCFHLWNWISLDIPEFMSMPCTYILFVKSETLIKIKSGFNAIFFNLRLGLQKLAIYLGLS